MLEYSIVEFMLLFVAYGSLHGGSHLSWFLANIREKWNVFIVYVHWPIYYHHNVSFSFILLFIILKIVIVIRTLWFCPFGFPPMGAATSL